MARSLRLVSWLCVLPVLIAACTRDEPRTSASAEVRQSAVDCHAEPAASSALCRERQQGQTIHYIDTQDGGDDPETAGCHLSSPDPTCATNRQNYRGDFCTDSNTLEEYTDTTCHTAPDRKTYDCNAYCKKAGHDSGSCRTVSEKFCAPHGSAFCKCVDIV